MEYSISLAAMEHILKRAGAPRVGEDAKEKFRELLEEFALQKASMASILAKHAGRKTIKAEDVSLAFK